MKPNTENLILLVFFVFVCTLGTYGASGVDPFNQANALSNQTEIKR